MLGIVRAFVVLLVERARAKRCGHVLHRFTGRALDDRGRVVLSNTCTLECARWQGHRGPHRGRARSLIRPLERARVEEW